MRYARVECDRANRKTTDRIARRAYAREAPDHIARPARLGIFRGDACSVSVWGGGDGDTLEEALDSIDEDGTVAGDRGEGEAGDPDATDGPGFGEAIEADVELTGAVQASYGKGDADTPLNVAGGCIPADTPTFGVNLQVLDTSVEALGGGPGVTAARVTGSVEADLAGGSTGTFDLEDLAVSVFDPPGDLATEQAYRGQGVLDITVHDAPAELTERRMDLTISGEGLSGDAGEVDLQVDLVWVMGCT